MHNKIQNKPYLYIHAMKYYSAIKRNERESFELRWMNLQPVTQSEVIQKGENKYILMDIYGIQKNGTEELICEAVIEMQIQKMKLWTQLGKERVG